MPRLTLFLYFYELDSMDEYSTTLPTGTTIGKFWKRNENVFQDAPPKWVVKCYAEDPDPEFRRILWFDVVLREGPKPPGWEPPDWSNYQRWEKDREQGCPELMDAD